MTNLSLSFSFFLSLSLPFSLPLSRSSQLIRQLKEEVKKLHDIIKAEGLEAKVKNYGKGSSITLYIIIVVDSVWLLKELSFGGVFHYVHVRMCIASSSCSY